MPQAKTPANDTGTKNKTASQATSGDSKKTDQTAADNNPVTSVLAGFLLAQIEPTTTPANDTAPVTGKFKAGHPAKGAQKGKQQAANQPPQTPANAIADVPPAPPASTTPATGKTDQLQIAAVEAGLKGKGKTKQSANAADGLAPHTENKPAAPHSDSKPDAGKPGAPQAKPNQPQAATGHDKNTASQQQAANAPAPQPKPTPQPAAGTHTPPTPPPAPPANHASAATAPSNPLQATTPSGTHALASGLHIAAQHHDTTATLGNLGVSIATKMADGHRQFDIRLDPPDLGRVDVRLTTDDSGKTQANLVVDKPQTLQLLQRDAPNLNRALTEAGLNLSNNGLNFSLREQFRQNNGGEDKGRGRSLSVQAVVQTDAIPIHSSLGSYAPNSVRLDIRV